MIIFASNLQQLWPHICWPWSRLEQLRSQCLYPEFSKLIYIEMYKLLCRTLYCLSIVYILSIYILYFVYLLSTYGPSMNYSRWHRMLHFSHFLVFWPLLAWNIWFEAPSLLPAKWQCQNSPSEGNFIEKCFISEHFIIPSLEEKSSIFS